MRIRESLARTGDRLCDAGVPVHRIEAEVLLRHVLGMERAEFFAELDERLAPQHERQVWQLVRRRLDGEPLAYIVGHREFYGLNFVVNSHVLIPRQETELLVDKVLELFSADVPGEHPAIADIGTGSGAIAIAIATHLPRATVYATDASAEALAVTDTNRRRHGVSERVYLCQGDLLEALPGPVDVIVSNPPYIGTREIARLSQEVRREPACALDGGADGLEVSSRLVRQAESYVRPGGHVFVEIAPEQLDAVSRLARHTFPTAAVSFARDLLGLPRAVIVELN